MSNEQSAVGLDIGEKSEFYSVAHWTRQVQVPTVAHPVHQQEIRNASLVLVCATQTSCSHHSYDPVSIFTNTTSIAADETRKCIVLGLVWTCASLSATIDRFDGVLALPLPSTFNTHMELSPPLHVCFVRT